MTAFEKRKKEMDRKYGNSRTSEAVSEKKSSQPAAAAPSSKLTAFQQRKAEMDSRYNRSLLVDDSYISSFLRDSQEYLKTYDAVYGGANWKNIGSVYQAQSEKASKLRIQSSAISQYLDSVKTGKNPNRTSSAADDSNLREYLSDFDAALNKSQYRLYSSYQKNLEQEKILGYDVDAGRDELADMEARIADAKRKVQETRMEHRFSDQAHPAIQEYNRLRTLHSEMTAQLNQMEQLQRRYILSGVNDRFSRSYDPQFPAISQYRSTELAASGTYGDLTYEYINGKDNGMRQAIFTQGAQGQVSNLDTLAAYDTMTEDEIGIYNYYYAKDGKQKAEQYLDSIRESLNYRTAKGIYSDLERHTALEMLFGAAAGVDQFASGVKSLMSREDYIPQSTTQMLSGMVRQDLADVGPRLPDWLGGGSLGQAAYDTVTTTANMAPSILSSMAANAIVPGSGAFVGNAAMFAGAAGNAYQEALNLGYDKSQARGYSTLVGLSEAGLQKALGGISALGGTGKKVIKYLDGVDNALLRIGGRLLGNMASEGLEEVLQEILTSALKELTLMVDEDVTFGQVAYSFLLGAITAGVLESGSVISGDRTVSNTGKQLRGAGVSMDRLAELGKTMSADSVAYQLAGKVNENTGAYTIGRLFHELGAEITEQNQADIRKSLVRKGFTERQARVTAEAFARVVTGENTFTEEQLAVIEGNELLSRTVVDVIINPNSTVNQRSRGYNEMLMQLARDRTGTEMTDGQQAQAAPAAGTRDGQTAVANEQRGKTADSAKLGTAVMYPPVSSPDSSPERGAFDAEAQTAGIADAAGQNSSQPAATPPVSAVDEMPLAVRDAVADMGLGDVDAQAVLQGFDPAGDLTVDQYALQMRNAFRFGQYGIPEAQTEISEATSALEPEQRRLAYSLGRRSRAAQTAREQQERRSQRENPARHQSYLDVPDGIWSRRTEAQEVQINGIGYVAEAMQVKIHIYEAADASDPRSRLNGWYENGEIWLNLHAGRDASGAMLFTLSHELTHHIRESNPEGFQRLADFLMEEYGRKGVQAEQLIDNKLPAVKRLHKGENLSEEALYDLAYEEVVADSMEPMLTDGRVLRKLRGREQSLFEMLREQVQEWADRIRSFFQTLQPDSIEGQHVLEMKERIEQIEDLFLEALEGTRTGEMSGQTQTPVNAKNPAQEGGRKAASAKYSERSGKDLEDKYYARQIDQWDGQDHGGSFRVGKASRPLLDVGIPDADIWFDQSKAAKQLAEKEEIDKGILKRIPEVLANPIVISESYDNTALVFGQLFDDKGNPIVIALRINSTNRRNHITLVNKIRSVGTRKRNLDSLLSENNILWLGENKKETRDWFNALGRSTPFGGTKSGFIRILSQNASVSQGEVRYQERNEDLNQVNDVIREQNVGMAEDLKNWKQVYEILNIKGRGGIFTQGSVKAVAEWMKKGANVQGKTEELTGLLMEAYTTLANRKALNWADVVQEFQPVMDWLMAHRRVELDSRAQDMLRQIRGTKIYLDPKQQEEAAYHWGSMQDYRRAHMGRIIIASKGSVSLDQAWQQWANIAPDLFPPDMNSLDMVQGLSDALDRLKGMTIDATFGIDRMALEQGFLQAFYDGLFRAAVYPEYIGTEIRKLTAENQKKILALKKSHEKRMDALSAYHEEQIQKLHGNYARKQEWRKTGREKTELRHKIVRTVKQLNSMLLRESKTRHIPETLKTAVLDALDAVNMDTVTAEARLQQLNEELAKATDPQKIYELQQRIATVSDMGGRIHDKLESLQKAYAAVREEMDPTLSYAFDEEINNQINRVKELVGTTPLRDMTKEQLQAVDELYTVVLTRVRTMNEAFATARQENIDSMGHKSIGEIIAGGKWKDERLEVTEKLRAFFWNNEKPVYAFERIGSETLSMLYDNVRKGEDTWARDMREAKEYQSAMAKRFGQRQWNTRQTWEFQDRLNKRFQLNLGQIMTLYAYSKRPQSWEHLQQGGFVFRATPKDTLIKLEEQVVKDKDGNDVIDTETGKPVTIKKWVPAKKWTSAQTFKLDAAILGDIISKLTPEQKAFADRMQTYLSSTMGAKGNEISMKLYGIRLFKERNYFPLKSSQAFLAQEANKANGEVKIKNKGFTKQTEKMANNPIYLQEFMDVWSDHVDEMALYHGFTLPLEDFYRVRNYKEGITETEGQEEPDDSMSVTSAIQGAHGKEAADCIEQLLKDLNGGVVGDSRAAIGKSLMGKHKKAAVMASLSVVVQQPTALYRAMSMVDARYFGADTLLAPAAFRTFWGKQHSQLWEEVKTYAPVAIIKEMGYFDTSVGRTAREFLNSTEYEGWKEKLPALLKDSSYRDEVFSKLPALADEMAWVSIWQAVKRETQARNPKLLKENREKFYQTAGDRFTEVICRTQVYDSVLSRSANMRSKDSYMNMATAFMAEPTTTANMVEDAVRKLRKGDTKYARRVLGAVLGSNIINSALVSLVYAMRDDDEESTFTEKYLSNYASKLIESLNPITYIPFAKDIWSIMQGYDVERSDMSLVSDLVTAVNKRASLMDEDVSKMDDQELDDYERKVHESNWAVGDILSSFLGFPLKNMRRDAKAVVQTSKHVIQKLTGGSNGNRTTAGSLTDKVLGEISDSIPGKPFGRGSRGDMLYRAILAGDQEYVRRLKAGYRSESSYNTALRKALRLNDSRIHEAAVARTGGKISQYRKIVEGIKKEKYFSQDDIVSAVNQEINAISKGEDSTAASKAKSFYTSDDFRAVLISGDTATAKAIREDILRVEQLNGKTAEEAQKAFENDVADAAKDGLLDKTLSQEKARNALVDWAGRTEEEAQAEIIYWEFQVSNPDTYASSKWFDEYCQEVEVSGIDIGIFIDYKNRVRSITGEGKKEKRMAVIHSLPISNAQKDTLYLAEGWTENRIFEAPWH